MFVVVCLFVHLIRTPNSKKNSVEKPKLVLIFHFVGVAYVPIFSSQG